MGQIANSRSRSSAALCESANRATASPSEGCSATSAAISSAREAAVEQSPLPATMGLKARPKAQPATPTRMITGAQIKAARLLLGWGPSKLAQRAKLPSAIIHRVRAAHQHGRARSNSTLAPESLRQVGAPPAPEPARRGLVPVNRPAAAQSYPGGRDG